MKRSLALLILVCAASSAVADSKQHVTAGVAAYEAGDYATASREFEVAYALEPDPVVLYAWAQALRLGKRCDEAVPLYRRYLATNPNDTQIAAATTGIASCARQGAARETPPPPPPPPPLPNRRPWYHDKLGGALAIGGTVALGTGIGFVVVAYRTRDDASEIEDRGSFIERLDEATLQRRIGMIGIGVGLALVAGGIWRYASRPDERGVKVSVTPVSIGVLAHF
jgi:tetratricopeptide (TPR) repeat protein